MNRSKETPMFGATRVISITGQSAGERRTVAAHSRRVEPLDCCAEHEGYRLNALARPTTDELYAADLVIVRPGFASRHFRALDQFYDATQALRYAMRWGRIWVDHELEKNARNVSRMEDFPRQP
ncbi:hypothetical protein [Caballeronia zhejiangensis]|nr:hypothetical protein [Caballeronia zhejiangensis]